MPSFSLWSHPAFGIGLTLIMYGLALKLARKNSRFHPLFLCSAGIIAVLVIFRIPYESYSVGGQWITQLLGPATVALSVPLYTHWKRIVAQWRPIVLGVTTGTMSSLGANALLTWGLGGDRQLVLTMLPKSTTAPISLELVRMLGGIPELGALFTVLTGLYGSMIGTWFLGKLGIRDDLAIGIATGTAAHGIGTGKVIRDSELQGAYSGLAMGLAGLVMSVLTIPVYYLIH
ncbi:LrgB family protein [Paenibacillus sp. GCM10027626]|uniref:LrgB family protein n=1 Tax=Paenibacillus sp. GCM10027626 TaxID=3273411 RepID=UPI0036424AFC